MDWDLRHSDVAKETAIRRIKAGMPTEFPETESHGDIGSKIRMIMEIRQTVESISPTSPDNLR